MPLTHERTFRVRHYECDAFGHLNNVAYVRYMQEAAFDASAAAGYDLAKYDELGQHWLVRETKIDYQRPLRYGDAVRIKTWVKDFRRIRSRRAYEFTHVESGELVARGSTDWVYLDMESGRPAVIPDEMMAAFFPEGPPDEAPPRRRFPDPPPPPEGVFTHRRRVEWRDIDPVGHVNNAVYLAYVEEAGFAVCAAHRWPLERMQVEGFIILVRSHHVEYRLPAVYGDELEIATWAYNMRWASASRAYTITRASDGELLARVNSKAVWVDTKTHKPVQIPGQFRRDFAPNMVD